jgi:transcriptional regulator with XRE-family HTH domain
MPTKNTQETIDFLENLSGPLTLGSMIQAIRKGEEMSQVEFANLLGVSKQYLCDIEHERRFISPKMAATFATKLGYSKEQFIRICLKDMLWRDGFSYMIELKVHVA